MTLIRAGGVPEHFNLPWRLVEEDHDFLKKNNIQIRWQDIHGGTGEMVEKLADGELEVCVLLTEGITKAIHSGLDAQIVHNYVKSSLKWGIHVPSNGDINQESDIDLQQHVFAVSRYGSGSHLMVYVLAEKHGWDTDQLQFKVVNSLEGGLSALEEGDAHVFLWEKFTTNPYTVNGRCKFVGEVPTPWPCFSVAANNLFLNAHQQTLELVLQKVMEKAKWIKSDPGSVHLLSERYDLEVDQVTRWLSETEWNINLDDHTSTYEDVKKKLIKLEVIS